MTTMIVTMLLGLGLWLQSATAAVDVGRHCWEMDDFIDQIEVWAIQGPDPHQYSVATLRWHADQFYRLGGSGSVDMSYPTLGSFVLRAHLGNDRSDFWNGHPTCALTVTLEPTTLNGLSTMHCHGGFDSELYVVSSTVTYTPCEELAMSVDGVADPRWAAGHPDHNEARRR